MGNIKFESWTHQRFAEELTLGPCRRALLPMSWLAAAGDKVQAVAGAALGSGMRIDSHHNYHHKFN